MEGIDYEELAALVWWEMLRERTPRYEPLYDSDGRLVCHLKVNDDSRTDGLDR